VGIVVSVDGGLPFFGLDLTIDSFVSVVAAFKILLDELEHVGELGKNEDFFALSFALFE
jgi:hypothetical protein